MKYINYYASAILVLLFLFTGIDNYAQQGMGVGVANPQEKLDVDGAIKIGTTNNTNAGTIRWTGTEFQGYNGSQWLNFGGSGGWLLNGNSGTTPSTNFIGTTDNTDIRFRTNNLERMTITNAGNIGIGTNTPQNLLHIVGSGTNEAHGIRISASNGHSLIYHNGQGDLVLRKQSEINQLVLDASGNVGIGTVTTSSKLHVDGPITMVDGNQQAGYVPVSDANGTMTWTDPANIDDGDWTVSGNNLFNNNTGRIGMYNTDPRWKVTMGATQNVFVGNDSIDPDLYGVGFTRESGTNGEGIGIGFGSSNSGLHCGAGIVFKKTGNSSVGDLMLAVKKTYTSFDVHFPALTVQGISGNIGIGTTDPSDELYVANRSGSSSTATFESGSLKYPIALKVLPSTHASSRRAALKLDDWVVLQDRVGNGVKDFTIYQISTAEQRLTISASGNVGLGEENPQDKLHVNGSIRMVDGNQQAGYISVSDANGTMAWTDPATLNDGDWTISGNNISNANSGNVGVGTNSPESLLSIQVDNNGLNYPLIIRNRNGHQFGGNAVGIAFTNNDNLGTTPKALLVHERTGAFGRGSFHFLMSETTGGIAPTLSDSKVTITSDGNLGVGTQSPATLLHTYNASTEVAGGWEISQGVWNSVIYHNANGDLVLRKFNRSDQLVLDESGNVGIGTAGVSNKLHVEGSIRMVDGNQSAGYIPVSDANGTMTWTDPSSINDGDWTVSGNDISNANLGNVGIGTTNPESILNIRVENDGLNYPLVLRNTHSNQGGGNAVGIGFTNNDNLSVSPKAMLVHERTGGFGQGSFHFLMSEAPNSPAATLSDAKVTITSNGNLGVGTTTPSDELEVQGSIRMVDGNQQNGYIPVSNANGRMTWTDPLSITTAVVDELIDADNDTKIQVEESSDEDIIRFDLAGTEYFVMKGGRLEVLNTGGSVFIGDDVGLNDDLSANNNVFVGTEAGKSTVDGDENVAIGTRALSANISSRRNTAIGVDALANATGGGSNVAIGNNAMRATTTGGSNVAIGKDALRDNETGAGNTAVGRNSHNRGVSGSNNTALGQSALFFNTSGDNNTVVGNGALANSTSGGGNIALGHNAGYNETGDNKLYIENSASSSPLIYGEFDNDLVGINGNLGIGTQAPSDELHVEGSIRMVDGNQQAGYIPVSDANGIMTWTNPGTIAGDTLNIIADADNDTKIQVEESSDEDKIRFDLGGTEMFRMERFGANGEAGINVQGQSLYMGQNISSAVSGTYNIVVGSNAGTALGNSSQNVLIGNSSGRYQTSGEHNTALGFRSAVQNLTGSYGVFVGAFSAENMTDGNFNLIMGYGAALNKSSGSQNVLLGANTGYNSGSGRQNVFVGANSGRNATGSLNVFIGRESGFNETGDNKLYIENSTSSSPLIYGEFDNDIVAVNGNLGVATTTPAASINILEADESTTQTDFTQNVADAGLLVTTDYTNGAYTPGLFWNTSNNNPTLPKAGIFMQETNSGSKILFGTSNAYASGITNTNVVINENGNVGIGTSNPGSLLDINAASGNAIINLVPGTSSIPRIWFRNPGNSVVWNIGSNTSEHFAFFNGQTSSTPFIIEKGGTSNTLVVDENSRVGIGTNAPAEELEVQGSIRMVDGNQSAGYIPVSDANGTMTWTDPSSIDDGDWTVSGNDVYRSGNGNVGIGTTSPSSILSLGGDANRTIGMERSTGTDGFDLTLKAGGAKAGVADRSGGNLILSGGISTGNGNSISNPDSKIIFMTSTPLGSSSSSDVAPTEKMRVTAHGNLGVGSTSPASKLVVQDNANGFEGFVARVINTANSNSSRDEGLLVRAGHNSYNSSQESSLIQFEKPNGAYMGRIRQSGSTAVEYVSASDERLKTDITPTEYGLDNLLNIDVKDYYFKDDKAKEGRQTGFIAQQLYQHYPVAVDIGSEDLSQPWGVAYGMMTPLLVKSIQEQQAIIEEERQEKEDMQATIELLMQRLQSLEQTVATLKGEKVSASE